MLSQQNVSLAVDGDELVVRGERERLDSALIELLRQNKAELLEFLRTGAAASPLVTLSAAEMATVIAAVPGGAENVQDVYPLAPLQEGILFHHLLSGEGDPYLFCETYWFENRERLDAYLAALQRAVDRHDALRTAILWEGLSEPVQVVLRSARLIVEEIGDVPADADTAQHLAARFSPRHHRLDLRRAPLLRAVVAREPHGERWAMLLLEHHIWGDNTSVHLLRREIEAHLLGRADELPAPVSFGDFITQARRGVSREEHELFFRELLADVDEPTAPFGLVDVQRDGSRIREASASVGAALAERLRNAARAAGVSTASIVHVAWARVLARVSGRDDVVFGTVLFGRGHGEGIDRALGMFTNTLPVRVHVGESGVRESVERMQVLLAQLLRHEHAPLTLAQACSAVPASTPLFSSLLNYRHGAAQNAQAGGAWEGVSLQGGEERTNYPLGVSVNDTGAELKLSVKSDASVDPERLCGYVQTALAGVVDALERDAARALASVEIIPERERAQVLYEWNATEHPFPDDRFVHELFEEQAWRAPKAVALEFDGGRLSYGELNARANRLARHLRALGVEPQTRVGVMMERSLEFVVGALAVLKAGGTYVPLDPAYPEERLAFMLADAAPPVVLTHARVARDRAELLRRSAVRVVDVVADADAWSWESECNPAAVAAPSDPAYVIYTSGSTGTPKGVIVSHEQLCSRLLGAQLDLRLGRGDVVTNLASPAFDIALFELLMPLVTGGRSLLLGAGDVKDIARLRARTQRATVFHAVPTLMEAWLDSIDSSEYGSLHTLLVGGEAVPERLLRKLAERFPRARVFEFYGPTEAVIISTRYRADGSSLEGVANCIGRPFANTRTYVLDARLQPAPVGVAGELYIGGAQVARGYLNRDDLTAERFIASPFVDGDRLYKTGDMARYLPDGNIEFLGRNDFQVKIRGFRIELGEIEARLWSYPGVRDVAVVALEDRTGEKRLVAYFTADAMSGAPGAPSAEELRSHVAAALPEYMIPTAYVQLDALPLTAHGKLDRRALPAPDESAYASRAYEAPAGEIELTLAAVWRELLGVERVGRNDNFFELGGHSLLVVAALERLRQVGLHVDAAAFFASTTLSELASAVREESLQVAIPPNAIPENCTAITPAMLPLVALNAAEIAAVVSAVPGGAANVQDIYPLAPLQEGVLFHHLLGGEGDPYLSRTVYRFESRDRLDAYLRALESVIARHDVLRTAVLWEGLPEPVQVVLRQASLTVEEVSADPSAGDVGDQLAERFNPRHFRLDVRQAPIMRVYAARDGSGDGWAMVLLKHHLLGDHTAMELTQAEVEAHLLGQADELPAPVPFRNFIAQSRLGVSREEHELFFREMLADVDEPTAPYGLVDVRRDGSTTRQSFQVVDAAVANRLRNLARSIGVSTASICHVAWARVLARVSGRDDVVFGTLMFGRMQGAGADRALGMFMNTLPVRLRVDGRGVRESVDEAQLLLAQLLRHEHASLALAQRCSAVPGSLPLFTSLLNYRHDDSDTMGDAWEGITVEEAEERTNYPIGMSVNDHGGGALSLSVKSDASVDPARLSAYMQTALAGIAEALEHDPARALTSVEVVPEHERRQVLVEWNATDRAYAAARCVHELFEEQVSRSPESAAVELDGERLSYGELNARSNRLARHLQALGVGAETRVGVLMERSLELVIGLLGVLKAGGVYVPLDPAYPSERLAYMLGDAAPPVVLTHERVARERAGLLALSPARVVDVVADADRWSAEPDSNLPGAAAPSDLAYVIYTSGSTGAPKGVMVSHAQLCSRLLGAQLDLGFGSGDVVTNLASPAFDIALFELLMPLTTGGASLLLGSAQVKDIEQLRARTQHATVFHAVPTLMEAWLDSIAPGEYGSLHTLLVGGEAVPERLLRKLTERFPHARVFEFYGPTEAVIISTRFRADGSSLEGVANCIGRPFANTRTYILDARLQPAPIGVGGELYIGGAQVARGYLNRADLTAERFIASPFVDGDRLYKTGDMARYLPDGNIEFLGRNDFQVKIRGFRIELGEIEARLWSYPGVREVAVIALEDRTGEKRLVAYFTASSALTAEELRTHVAATLPEYMIPAAYVQLDALPLTAHGKLDRRALPAPDDGAYVSRAYEAPAGEIELTLAAVWRELLAVERVGRNDNFFELGGHSLLVVAALERLRQVGLHVDAAAFFASATLKELAGAVHDESLEVAIPPSAIPDGCTEITPAMLPLVQLSAPEIAGIVASVPGGAANVQDVYPLAPLQEGVLFHHLLGGEGDPYLSRTAYRFESRERLDAYLHALESVIARHDVLRTAVLWEGLPEPVQVVLRRAPLTVEEVTVDPTAGDAAEQLAERFNPRHFRLDVRQAPIMRAYVARDGRNGVDDAWAMVLLKHHLLGDHTAMEVMEHEVEAHLLGRADELPAPVPFRNFIAQARLGVSREEHELFFREMLSDVDEPTAPFGLVDVRRDGSTTRQTYQVIDASLAERLRNVARSAGVSTASICHVAWARVLARVSGRDDVVFGTLLFGRMQGEGSDRAIGMFMNTLPVRLRIGKSVRESVQETQLLLAELLRHEHAPLALAQRCSAVPGSTPLFSSLLNYRHGASKSETSTDAEQAWKGIAVLSGEERTNYPVGMSVNDHGDELSLSVKSDESVDPDRLCGYMQTALAGVVEALERDPACALANVEVVPERERAQIVYEWNATEHAYDAARCVHELFEEQAARARESVALEFDGERLSYGELNAQANRLARHLQTLGVQAQTRVGVLMERSLEFVVGVLGVLKAGGTYVPLDPAYPHERLSYMLADAAPPVVLTHGRVDGERAELIRRSPVRVIDVSADAGDWSAMQASDLQGAAAPSDSAYVIYTSGSTGAPKGVMVSHEQLCSRLLGAQLDLGFGSGDVVTNLASPAFDIALFELLMPLTTGGTSLLLGSAQVKDIAQLRARTQQATVFHAVPTLMEAWLDSLGASEYGSLHTLLVGGEAVPERLLRKLTERFPQARVFEFYGPTEAVIISTRYRADSSALKGVANCIGRPFANTRAYVLDARLEPAPIGVGGELYIGGAQVALGYLNRADLTKERFIASPFVEGDRLYKTGDLARYLPDGNIEFLGRNDFQVKIRGFRIELGEIEACLASHPGVREAVVLALEDRDGEKRLVAYYTTFAVPGADELRSHVAAALPDYMIPTAFVHLDALPLTAHGKLDRRALPAPDEGAYVSRAYEAPVGETELTLAAVWRELLKVERVGRNDNFFELGGHSLLVVAALERLRQVGLHVDAAAFFAAPALSALAASVRDESLDVAIPPNAIPENCTTIMPEMLPLVQLSGSEIANVVATVPGGAANVQDVYPLAPLQEGILFHHILGGDGDPYLGRSTYRFESRERLDAYLHALEAVIARHDVLRTAVLWEGLPEPVQVVLRNAPLAVEEVTAGPAAGDVAEQLAECFNPRHFRLDVRQAPIMRAYVARDPRGDGAGDAWAMVLLKHHLLGDHTAMEVMEHEVEAHLLGRADELPAPVPFRNFIAQARLGVSRAEHELFFREMLGDVDEPTAPFGLVDVRRDGSTTRQTYQVVDESLAERLRQVARSAGVSTASICHVAWARVLARVSGRDDVVFGTLLFGRMQGEGSGRALGMFMNTLPVRLKIDERGVRESVEETQLLLAQLLRHEHAPLTLAQACSAVPASTPLFSSLLNYRHGKPRKSGEDEGWKGFAARGGEERTNYPIGMSVNDHGDELSLSVKSDASVDPDRLCGYMQAALAAVVDALENEPARALVSIEVVPERERRQVLVEWNATERPYPTDRCVHQLFEEQAARLPEAAAVELDGERLSYGELNARANRLARHLRALHVQAGTHVGVLMERSPEFVVAVLAVLKAGGTYVPLDPAYPQERLAFMLGDAAPPVVLTHERVAAERAELLRESTARVVDVAGDAASWAAEPAVNLRGAASASDLAYVIYTSGSTGAPKGVMVTHGQLCSRLLGAQRDLGFGDDDVVTNLASPAFDIALFELLMPLVNGGRSLLLSSSQVKDPEQLRARTQHATVFHAVPTLMEAWLDALGANDYRSLHTVLVGGEAVPERLLIKLLERFPKARVFEFYGPTEAVIISTRYRVDGIALNGVTNCIGRPFANTRTYVLDARMEPTPIGVGGELYIGGAHVARGYLNRAELTAERFIPSPFVPGDRLYKTGDLARYLPDGNLEFLGRNDFQVKIRGFRIELGEIEAHLAAHPGVRDAAVVPLEDRTGEKRLVAYYVAPEQIAAEELRGELAAVLPEYMVPAAYVHLDALPLTAHGKLDRRALPTPDDSAYASHAYEAPVGETELTLAAVWRELLKVERVGRNDNFFELGGHSLLVVAALERLRQVGLHVDAAAFFASTTLAELASAVRDESSDVAIPPNAIPDGCTAITPEMLPLLRLSESEIATVAAAVPGGAANVQDIYPLAPLQEGILFHHILGGDGDPYLGRSTYRFESRERLDAYLHALDAVIARHDVLRTAVLWENLPEPVQVVLRRAPLTVEEITVDPVAGDVAEQLAARFNPRHFRLDVRQAPIMRAYVARDGAGDGWAMVLLKHHLLGDHTAMEVMQHEVEAHLLGRAEELPAPVPFRNFIAQARLGVSREEHEQFFRDMLADVDEPTAPFGLVDVRRDGSTTRSTHAVLDTSLAERLRNVARSVGVSTASICHVAWARVLARVSGRDDVVFGTLLFGRMQGEGSNRALGMFMNTLPVRLKIDQRGVREGVEETQLLLAQLLRHEHAPLTLAQSCSAVPASTPLFSSLLNYRHGKPRRKQAAADAVQGIAARGGEERTNYPIGMSVNDHGDELSLSVKSDASVDPDRLSAYMQTALAAVVDALENEPTRALTSLEVVPERERTQLLVEWNATERDYAAARCVHELFEEQVARAPEAVALEFGGERLSYSELNAQANRLARHLQAQGVQAQARAGVLMERSLEFVVAVLAVFKAGGTYVPLDPAYPQERLSYIVQDSAPALLLTHDTVATQVRDTFARSGVPMVDVVADADRWSEEPASDLHGAATPSDLAYVIYTSGSTGAPKGVMVTHEQLCSRLLGAQLDLAFRPDDAVTNLASPAFDIALFELLMPLTTGGCSLLLTSGQVKDVAQLRARTQHATVFHAVPTLMEAWLDSLGASEYGALHTLLVGGEAVPERLLRKLTERFPKARVFEFYGPTETVIISTRYRADGSSLEGVANCIGRPFANTRVYILDARLDPAPIGVGGELYIGGAQVARGYLNREDLTLERFVPSPFVDGDRLYKTGDLARYLPDGNIEFLGRNDFQVKIRGFRIELGEIEARLASHPAVREAVVLALEDRAGERRLVAYYIAPDALAVDELRAHVAAALPDYMVPAAFVHLDALPLTAHGKLDRRALPAPDDGAYASRAYEAPSGDVELTLAAVWRELLKVERVGRNDNFFELGGHSLLVVAALERLRQVGLHVDAAAFFASNTLRELASAVRDESLDVVIPPNAIPDDCTEITPEMLPLVQLGAAEIAGIVAAVPGGAANVQDVYPLAPLQEGILFHHMLGGEGDPYLGRSTYRFESRERLDAYLAALEAIIARHDVLRTAVAWEGLPEPVQVVLRRAPLTVEELTVDPSAGDVADQLAARFNPRHFRLDVRHAPMMRAYVARDGEGDAWSMVLLKHHLLGDHTAMELMQREIEAHLLGRADELPPPVPFRNFIAQARLGVSREEHEQFFRDMLADVDEPTAPFGLVNVQGDGSGTRRTYQPIDAALAERLRNAARSIGVSTASICHVAWARVLAAVSGRDDVVFGSVLLGRMQGGEGADRALGMFMNTLPVRLRIGERGVAESIEEAHLLLAELLRHEHAPLALAQRCSSVPASIPLFSSLLNYRHGKPRKKQGGDEAWKGIAARGGEERTNYPVTISVNDHGDELSLSAQTDASVDPDRLCESMQTVLAQLVEAIESEPARALARIGVLSARERAQALVEWNATERPYPADLCVHELFELQARASSDAVAVEDEHASLTYAELNAQTNRLARHLRAHGVGPDVRVAVCMERSVELVVALLAVFKAGGAYVPLDPDYPAERLAYVALDSAPALVLTHAAVADPVREALGRSSAPAVDVVADAARWAKESGDDLARDGLLPSHLAYVIYTSGSTGRPKGAMNEHRAVVNRLLWMQEEYALGADDAVLQKTPFSFDVSVWELFWPLLTGARLVMARPGGHKDPDYLARIAGERRITTMHFVPSMLGYFLDEPELAARRASLKNVMCSGEALTKALVERFYERLPFVHLSNLYGPTEAAVDVTAWRCPRENVPANVPIGKPIANTKTYVLDARLEPVPIGVAGELYIGGVQVGRGYWNRPELTAERFIANPFVAGERLYKTGDLARLLPDGSIEYLGRNDFQVKLRGFRIELGEIEARLAAYPGVREAVVTAPQDTSGEKRLVAYYTAAEELDAQALRAHLMGALPEYMVPAAYVHLESLPLTPSGKLDRKALPAPDGSGYASRAYEAPAGELETALAAIWSELLKVERVGRHDNFFELGGHSLLAMRVLSRVRQAFALEAKLSDVFAHPTLASFARALETSTRSALPPILPADRSRRIPLSFSQERLWFSVQLDPNRTYHIPFGLPLKGELDANALRRALDEIVARHEPLRTTFAEVDGEPVQRIGAADAGFRLVEHDLRSVPDAAAELQRISLRERQEPFDLQAGPLVRGRLITTADDEHLLAVTMHHLISDGWSTGVFMRELNALYGAYRAGRPSPLAPLAIQYADYATWQRQWLSGQTLQDQAAYWQRTLAGAPVLLELPTDRPRPAVSDHRGASLAFELDTETTARVKALSRRHGSTLFITLLTAWGALLARLSGQDDVVIGTQVANRPRPELEPLIGFFVNTLALRLEYGADATVGEMLNRVKDRVIAGQDHQDIPFEQVVEAVNPPRSLAHNAIFQTTFVWNNAERGVRALAGLETQAQAPAPSSAVSSQVDLTLELAEHGERIAGRVIYATALFDAQTVERYCGYLRRILAAMVEDDA